MSASAPDFNSLRIVFAGTPDFASAHLQALVAAGANIVAVYTQPDRPAGRGKKLTPSPVKELAEAQGIPVLQPERLREAAIQQEFAQLAADVFVVVAYGLIIPKAILDMPTYGCINVHGSLLPRWRGAAPIQRAIEAGDSESGVTIMQMDVGLDTGDMLAKVHCAISPAETGGSLHDKLAAMGPPALLDTLSAIALGTLSPEKQDDSQACYAAKITKQEAELDWRRPAIELECQIRAFNPFPVTHSQFAGQQLRVWQARRLDKPSHAAPGTIIAVTRDSIEVACGDSVLALEEVQLPGKKRLSIAEIVRGNADLFTAGKQFSGLSS